MADPFAEAMAAAVRWADDHVTRVERVAGVWFFYDAGDDLLHVEAGHKTFSRALYNAATEQRVDATA